jgi:hypothetical protein
MKKKKVDYAQALGGHLTLNPWIFNNSLSSVCLSCICIWNLNKALILYANLVQLNQHHLLEVLLLDILMESLIMVI